MGGWMNTMHGWVDGWAEERGRRKGRMAQVGRRQHAPPACWPFPPSLRRIFSTWARTGMQMGHWVLLHLEWCLRSSLDWMHLGYWQFCLRHCGNPRGLVWRTGG